MGMKWYLTRGSCKTSKVDTEVDPPASRQAYSASFWRGRLRPALMNGRFCKSLTILFLAAATAVMAERPTVTRQEAALLEQAADVAQKNQVEALALIEAVRERDRVSAPVDYSAANLMTALERYEEAEEAYREALEKWPGFDEAQLGLARVLTLQARWADSETLLRDRAQSADATTELLLLYGHVLLELNRAISAETVFRRAAWQDGDSRAALGGLARSFLVQQRWAECAALAEELVAQYPGEGSYWRLLADARLAKGDRQAAVVALESARRLGAADAAALILLGELHVAAGRTAEAARVLDVAAREAEAQPGLWLRLAESLAWSGLWERAEEVLDRYAARDGEPTATYFRTRARLAEQQADAAAERVAYASWVRHDPVNREALLALGDWYAAQSEWAKADTWYERAAQAHANDAAPWTRLARTAMAREDYAQAESHLARAHVLGGGESVEQALQQVRRLRALQDED